MSSKCFFLYCNTGGEGDAQERKTQPEPLPCIQLFIFTKHLGFYFQDFYPKLEEQLEKSLEEKSRHFFILSALQVLSSRKAGAGDNCTGTHWSILQRTC